MNRLTKVNEYGAIEPPYALKSLEEDNDWSAECREKLAYYEDLEEGGRLMELPCKLKDIVWQVVKCSDNVTRIFEMRVCSLCKYGSIYNSQKEPFLWNVYLEDKDGFGYSYATFYDFGKSVFLTREEAELKLKEMESGL